MHYTALYNTLYNTPHTLHTLYNIHYSPFGSLGALHDKVHPGQVVAAHVDQLLDGGVLHERHEWGGLHRGIIVMAIGQWRHRQNKCVKVNTNKSFGFIRNSNVSNNGDLMQEKADSSDMQQPHSNYTV